jgi:hypothetical protein
MSYRDKGTAMIVVDDAGMVMYARGCCYFEVNKLITLSLFARSRLFVRHNESPDSRVQMNQENIGSRNSNQFQVDAPLNNRPYHRAQKEQASSPVL